jgi:hypothetical protein
MNEPAFDPLSDIEPAKPEEASRRSVASFWIGCSGLAILAHLAIFLALRILGGLQLFLETFVFANGNDLNSRGNYWEILRGIAMVFNDSLMPFIVIATVVPILFWRGGLGQRFAVSLALAITTMNYSLFNIWDLGLKSQDLQALLAILGCWLMFPILFLCTPIKTARLRLVAATCLLVLTVCVSVIHLIGLRRSYDVLSWVSLYGAAFLYALIRRNWGNVAILEAGVLSDSIERTSSRTLLEMMIACSLACAVALYLTKTELDRPFWYFAQTSLFGIVCVFVSLATIRSVLQRELKKIWLFVLCGLLIYLVMAWNTFSIQYFLGWNRWRNIRQFFDSAAPVTIGLGALFATAYWMAFLFTLGWWLHRCGWHLGKKQNEEPMKLAADHSEEFLAAFDA